MAASFSCGTPFLPPLPPPPRVFFVSGAGAGAAGRSFRDFVDAGGLASYSVDLVDLQRRAALYVDHILKGRTPAELPVQSPIKFELVINAKTAKALDITIPPKLLARADEVIK